MTNAILIYLLVAAWLFIGMVIFVDGYSLQRKAAEALLWPIFLLLVITMTVIDRFSSRDGR